MRSRVNESVTSPAEPWVILSVSQEISSGARDVVEIHALHDAAALNLISPLVLLAHIDNSKPTRMQKRGVEERGPEK
ncbi:MAG: hypothetical protein K2I25_05195, partial [Muribaculaceae bacterium]|nr:hypothetical protein [Muribaculaceae bacterium]